MAHVCGPRLTSVNTIARQSQDCLKVANQLATLLPCERLRDDAGGLERQQIGRTHVLDASPSAETDWADVLVVGTRPPLRGDAIGDDDLLVRRSCVGCWCELAAAPALP